MSASTSAGQRGNSLYATSDEVQSISGLSASEGDPEEEQSADEEVYQPQQRQSGGGFLVRSTSRLGPGTGRDQSRGISKQRKGSATPAGGRSESRGRRPSTQQTAGGGIRSATMPDYLDDDSEAYGPFDEEDDEVVPYDRGEELVRRRAKARQKEKRRKEKESQRRIGSVSNASRPTSPQPRPGHSRPGSPPLDRDNRPTFIPLPRQLGEASLLLSPSMMGPATSPGPGHYSFRASAQSGTGMYPSPHSHIRRPAAADRLSGTPITPGSNRRISTISVPNTLTPGPRPPSQQRSKSQRDSEVYLTEPSSAAPQARRPQSYDVRSSIAGSVAEEDEDEEGEEDEEPEYLAAHRSSTVGRGRERSQQSSGAGDSRIDNGQSEQAATDEGVDGSEAQDEEGEEQEGENSPDGDEAGSSTGDDDLNEDVEYTLKDRQDAINIEHPFGLPIWKPALYKKSRTVTRNAENALHSVPSRAAERHFLPGNLIWTIVFGIWLGVLCGVVSVLLRLIPVGGRRYSRVTAELAGYLIWPFGKYVEVEIGPHNNERTAASSPSGKYNYIDADGVRDGFADGPEDFSYTDAFTPVVARYPHDHEHHRVAFNSRPVSRQPSREVADRSMGEASSSSGGSSEGAKTAATTPRASLSVRETAPAGLPVSQETSPLKGKGKGSPASYGTLADDAEQQDLSDADRVARESELYEYVVDEQGRDVGLRPRWLGKVAYGLLFWLVIAPVLGSICLACWGLVFTIPMAKLSWVLLRHLATQPLALHFGSAPANEASPPPETSSNSTSLDRTTTKDSLAPLRPGQFASRSKSYTGDTPGRGLRKSKILLCTYRAIGLQYYKYTVGGINILFINTLPFVGFTIFDFFFIGPYVQQNGIHGFLGWISSQNVIFVCALGSVLPLSYFIGMAVASISAQSSIGVGAVINATFGSIIEIILYGIALTQEKSRLVEGSIVGSILAGVLLMPGVSMCSGATRRKEQRFNARSAGVTSTMLIMAIIGILTPTLFYQIYGTFQLTCTGCPPDVKPGQDEWTCKRCFYEHVPPATDPFYQANVKGLMYTCTVILVSSYAIGLWFSLRTHASQIWQNPQPAPAQMAAAIQSNHPHLAAEGDQLVNTAPTTIQIPSAQRASIYKRLLSTNQPHQLLPTQRPQSQAGQTPSTIVGRPRDQQLDVTPTSNDLPPLTLPESFSRDAYAKAMTQTTNAYQNAIRKGQDDNSPRPQQVSHQQEPPFATTQDTNRLSTMQAQQYSQLSQGYSEPRSRPARGNSVLDPASGGHHGAAAQQEEAQHSSGGHDAPSWSRSVSLTVLLSCTVLYAIIAEILVDVVDVVLDGSGIDEKFLGITLFALVPNTTEFMNAISFAISGNVALSLEIGSAYALQVALLQIPAMVAWSAYYNRAYSDGEGPTGHYLEHRSFTLIFPRWDVIAIIFAVFLLTYTYIEARSNYYRGS